MQGNTFSRRRREAVATLIAFSAASLVAGSALAASPGGTQGELRLLIDDEAVALETWERDYLYQALTRLQHTCTVTRAVDDVQGQGHAYRLSALRDANQAIELLHDTKHAGKHGTPVLILRDAGGATLLDNCEPAYAAPIVAVMASKRRAVITTAYAVTPETPAAEPAAETAIVEQPISLDIDSENAPGRLSAYEQNSLGWTRDDNSVDGGYMDANMSFKFRAWQGGNDDRFRIFLAFSTRFSQYIETIESSPVVGKRYNPLAFLRTNVDSRQGYVDLGFAHESNGQSITTEEAYLAERQKYADSDGEPGFARYSISRGWDYVFTDWTHCWLSCSRNYAFNGKGRFTTKFEFQYYLDDGPFQGEPEEFNDWEGGSERHRKEYDGVALTNDYRINSGCFGVNDLSCSISWEYRTGYDGIFENSTHRVQLSLGMEDALVPVGIWMQTGHNSSLADYYTSVDSFGISLLFSNPY